MFLLQLPTVLLCGWPPNSKEGVNEVGLSRIKSLL